jgi:charged multivesicular body protein 7
MQAYEASTATLAHVLSHPSLQRDRIETTMDALADTMADQQEIDEAIRSGGQVVADAAGMDGADDEDALEKELEALVIERREEEAEESKVKQLEEQTQERELVHRLATWKPKQDLLPRSVAPPDPTASGESTGQVQGSDAWEAVYEQAQARKVAETARAEANKLKKESRVSTAAQ